MRSSRTSSSRTAEVCADSAALCGCGREGARNDPIRSRYCLHPLAKTSFCSELGKIVAMLRATCDSEVVGLAGHEGLPKRCDRVAALVLFTVGV